MKNFATFILGLATSCSFAQAPSPLQLQSMQSRKFSKDFVELLRGTKTFCEDLGSSNTFIIPATVMADSVTRHPGVKDYKVGEKVPFAIECHFPLKLKFGIFSGVRDEGKFRRLRMEVVKADEGSVVVRLRAYSGLNAEQVQDAAVYAEVFKLIGDSLFIQAIPMEAAQQE